MTELVLLALTGAALIAAALLLRKSVLGRRRISPRAAVAMVGAVVALGIVYGYTAVFPARQQLGAPPNGGLMLGPGMLPPGEYPAGSLKIGDPAPPLLAQGWLNGPPPRPGEKQPKLILADLWASW